MPEVVGEVDEDGRDDPRVVAEESAANRGRHGYQPDIACRIDLLDIVALELRFPGFRLRAVIEGGFW